MPGYCPCHAALTLTHDAASVPPAEFVKYLPAGHKLQAAAPWADHWPVVHCAHAVS